MTICSSVTYFFLSWSLPQTYEFDFTDINNIVAELSNLLMNEYKENAPIWFEDTESLIESQYKNEFTIHIFQSDGLEMDLENIRELGSRDFALIQSLKLWKRRRSNERKHKN